MPGSLDARGVYIYAADDNASPTQDLLNLLGQSVSNALAGPIALVAKVATARSWRSIHSGSTVNPIPAGTPTVINPAAIVITNAAAGTYMLYGSCNAYASAPAAASAWFRVNGSVVVSVRNDVDTTGAGQSHMWTFDHAGGTLTLDYLISTGASGVVFQTQGSGLICNRIL